MSPTAAEKSPAWLSTAEYVAVCLVLNIEIPRAVCACVVLTKKKGHTVKILVDPYISFYSDTFGDTVNSRGLDRTTKASCLCLKSNLLSF